MTKKEALKQLGELKFALSGTDEQFLDIIALDMAIKALEQPKTDVIKKIRAEMQDYSNSFVLAKRNDLASAVSYCIEIIDKYRQEG